MATTDATMDSEWLASVLARYRNERSDFDACVAVLVPALQDAARRLAPLAFVEGRVKSIASFAEKIQRKVRRYHDPLVDMTDLCGVRVVVPTADEVKAVSAFIEQAFRIDWPNSVDASQRLQPAEFGYRSVHYVVALEPGLILGRELRLERHAPPLKAEIQVRTILEHAWASLYHDLMYKSAFKIPDAFHREFAAIAAALEQADRDFGRLGAALRVYALRYGAHLAAPEARAALDVLRVALAQDEQHTDVELAVRTADLAIGLEQWERVVEMLAPYAAAGDVRVHRNLGIAKCRLGRPEDGRRDLQKATGTPRPDVQALCELAAGWVDRDKHAAREMLGEAFQTDPTDPRVLSRYLQYEIASHSNLALVLPLTPMLHGAIQRCRQEIDAGLDAPAAHARLGLFHLVLGQPEASLAAYCRAVAGRAAPVLEEMRCALWELSGVRAELPGYRWVAQLRLLALAAAGGAEARAELETQSSGGMAGPVVIVAGGCDPAVEERMSTYQDMLGVALRGFDGTVVSGGTKQGISGIVGGLRRVCPHLRTLGYLPQDPLPVDAVADEGYGELRRTDGHGFSPLEPLQNWTDILAAGIAPADVKVLGVGGGPVARLEYRIALALGAHVGVVRGSGRAADDLLADPDWQAAPNLTALPPDPATIAAFLEGVSGWIPKIRAGQMDALVRPPLDASRTDAAARAAHAVYEQYVKRTNARPSWEQQREDFRVSTLCQILYARSILRRAGFRLVPADPGAPRAAPEFSAAETETMAELEHGRWVVERLGAGWRFGPVKDVEKKSSPYLVPWNELSEATKDYDREFVRSWPRIMGAAGLQIERPDG